ncbi:hypothetical protein C7M84_025336 [Penaeus vannamei]|uniref:3-hydroxyanthranilate 3,4-dioxygenase n=1 Tax=Penaeus vannamei TaxID=6689 RepID=A0A423TYF6_PENVA|nr:hypothetical protein C7M84_025336 [Penaeus vannamei]
MSSKVELRVFLLPGKIPHSPQRFAETIGLVIERERMKTELDGLRYYVEGTTDSLFERWFYCEDLGSQLGPIIKEYFASEQHKTGKPIPGTIPENPPFAPDAARKLEDPFPLAKWLTKHSAEIHQEGSKRLFDLSYQSDVTVFGRGTSEVKLPRAETWLWQLEGETAVTTGGKMVKLKPQDSLLLRADSPYSLTRTEGALTLSVVMDPGICLFPPFFPIPLSAPSSITFLYPLFSSLPFAPLFPLPSPHFSSLPIPLPFPHSSSLHLHFLIFPPPLLLL